MIDWGLVVTGCCIRENIVEAWFVGKAIETFSYWCNGSTCRLLWGKPSSNHFQTCHSSPKNDKNVSTHFRNVSYKPLFTRPFRNVLYTTFHQTFQKCCIIHPFSPDLSKMLFYTPLFTKPFRNIILHYTPFSPNFSEMSYTPLFTRPFRNVVLHTPFLIKKLTTITHTLVKTNHISSSFSLKKTIYFISILHPSPIGLIVHSLYLCWFYHV